MRREGVYVLGGGGVRLLGLSVRRGVERKAEQRSTVLLSDVSALYMRGGGEG